MSYKEIQSELEKHLELYDMECYPFKIEWYNECVDPSYRLEYDPNTFALLVISTPKTFDKLFLPFLFKNFKNNTDQLENLRDPIDECMNQFFVSTKEHLEKLNVIRRTGIEIDLIRDYELHFATRKAKIIMQTCAHVSGAAYFYDPKRFSDKDLNLKKKNAMGVCMHPLYGGWFAMRCTFIFKNLNLDASFQKRVLSDPLNGDEKKIIELLRNFNDSWRDWTYRDAVNPKEKYSILQQEYFDSAPQTRKDLIRAWLSFTCLERLIYSRECKLVKKEYLEKNFYLF